MAKPSPEVKTRFKMYKKGKLWLVAAAATAGLMAGGNVAQADNSTSTNNSDQAVVANTNTGTSNDNNSDDNSTVALTTTTAVSNDSQVATASEDAVSTTANESTSATNTTQKATSSTDQAINSASQASTEASKAAETVEQSTASATQDSQSNTKAETSSNAEADTVSMTTAAASASATDQSSTSTTKTTEVYSNGHWYLKDQNGNNLTGWQKLSGERTVFYNVVGQMQYGLQNINNKIYYFNTLNGAMYFDREAQVNGKWYNFTSDGSASTGFTKLASGKTVYYNSQGQMQYGLQNINGKIYYLNTWSGERYANREAQIDGKWYNFTSDGSASTGFTKLASGKLVYYNAQGQMQYGEQKLNNNWYYFNTWSGEVARGWYTLPDGRVVYYMLDENGQGKGMLHGQQEINGLSYYLNIQSGAKETGVVYNADTKLLQYYGGKNGSLVKNATLKLAGNTISVDNSGNIALKDGENEINGQWYYYDSKTKTVKTGWYKLDNNREVYYDLTTAQMAHGEKQIDGNWYYFNVSSGAEFTSQFASLSNNRIAYYNARGHMVYGEQEINGSWYYFNPVNGQEAISQFITLNDGRRVYYNDQGHMVKGWQTINGDTYYFNLVNGDMYTGTHYIDGTKHTFDSDGVEDTWGWPFPADGRGYFTGAQLFGVNAGGEFRLNGFHDGLDFGSIDHPGYEVHAVHKGTVTGIGYASGLDWYVLIDTGEYLTVYQEAFSSRSNIWVSVGQQVNVGDVIGGRTTAHLHLGITRQKNFSVALANSFNNNGTWINPLTLLGN